MQFKAIGNAIFSDTNYEDSSGSFQCVAVPAEIYGENTELFKRTDSITASKIRESMVYVCIPLSMSEMLPDHGYQKINLLADGFRSGIYLGRYVDLYFGDLEDASVPLTPQTFVESRKGVGFETGDGRRLITGGIYEAARNRPYGACELAAANASLSASEHLLHMGIKHCITTHALPISEEFEALARGFENVFPEEERMYQIVRWIPSNVRFLDFIRYYSEDDVVAYCSQLHHPDTISRIIEYSVVDIRRLLEMVPRTMRRRGNELEFFCSEGVNYGCVIAPSGIYMTDLEDAGSVSVQRSSLNDETELKRYVEGLEGILSSSGKDIETSLVVNGAKLFSRLDFARRKLTGRPAEGEEFWESYLVQRLNESHYLKLEKRKDRRIEVTILPEHGGKLTYVTNPDLNEY